MLLAVRGWAGQAARSSAMPPNPASDHHLLLSALVDCRRTLDKLEDSVRNVLGCEGSVCPVLQSDKYRQMRSLLLSGRRVDQPINIDLGGSLQMRLSCERIVSVWDVGLIMPHNDAHVPASDDAGDLPDPYGSHTGTKRTDRCRACLPHPSASLPKRPPAAACGGRCVHAALRTAAKPAPPRTPGAPRRVWSRSPTSSPGWLRRVGPAR